MVGWKSGGGREGGRGKEGGINRMVNSTMTLHYHNYTTIPLNNLLSFLSTPVC